MTDEELQAIRTRVGNVGSCINGCEHDSRALLAEVDRLRAERDIYRAAIRWALGEQGEFAPRVERVGSQIERRGPFWWRRELRQRAQLEQSAGAAQ